MQDIYRLRPFITIRNNGRNVFLLTNKDGSVSSFNTNDSDELYLMPFLETGLDGGQFAAWTSPLKDHIVLHNLAEHAAHFPAHVERFDLFLKYLAFNHETTIREDLLKTKKLLILGAGGGGSSIIVQLVQAGVTHIDVVDFDVVSPSDINRTMIYEHSHVGKLKVTVLKEEILRRYGVEIGATNRRVDEAALRELAGYEKYDLVVNCIDPNPVHKMNLNRIAHENNIPVLFIAYSFEMLLAGPLIVPGKTKCYESYNNYVIASTGGAIDFYKLRKVASGYHVHPSACFNIGMLSSFAVRDIIYFLLEKPEIVATLGRLLVFDTISLAVEQHELDCAEDCPVCGVPVGSR